MRWDSLFDDLEGQLDSAWGADDSERRAEDERLRISRLSLRERLITLGRENVERRDDPTSIRVSLRCGREIAIVPRTYGRDWLAADLVRQHGGNGACLIAVDAIASIQLRPSEAEESIAESPVSSHDPQITDRIGLPFVLRDLCRRRSYVSITTATAVDVLGGTIDRVARDHLDIARHPRGTARRAREVTHVQLVALSQLDLVEL